jgi:hypothetical protein
LNNGLNPVFTGKLDTVIEWEEGIRCHYRRPSMASPACLTAIFSESIRFG